MKWHLNLVTGITDFSSLYSNFGSKVHFDMEGTCMWVGGAGIRIFTSSRAWSVSNMTPYAIVLEMDKRIGMIEGVGLKEPLKDEDRLQTFPTIIERLREAL